MNLPNPWIVLRKVMIDTLCNNHGLAVHCMDCLLCSSRKAGMPGLSSVACDYITSL